MNFRRARSNERGHRPTSSKDLRSFFIVKPRGTLYDSFMKTTALSKNLIHTSPQRYGLLLIPLMLTWFGLAPMAQAVGPDTEGSMPSGNNGEGIGVLVDLTSGVWNTGTGFEALNHDTGGKNNTATGVRALFSNISGSYNSATGVYALYSNTTGWYNS